MEDDLQQKKRKQTTYVSKACDSCRAKHVKCDGNLPCARCVKKGTECLHLMVANKRGPTAGRIRELEDDLQETKRQLEEQKKRYEDLELRLQNQTIYNGENPQQQLTVSARQYRVGNDVMPFLFQFYNENAFPFTGVPVPNFDVDKYYNGQLEPTTKLLVNTILSSSYLISGNMEQATTLMQEAKSSMQRIYDIMHPYVAYSYYLFGMYNVYSSDNDKAHFHHISGYTISKTIMNKHRKGQYLLDESNAKVLPGIYANILFKLINDYSDSDIGFYDLLVQFEKFHNGNGNSIIGKEFHDFGIFIGKIRYLLRTPQNWQQCLVLLDEAQLRLPKSGAPHLQRHYQALIFAVRGIVYHAGGNAMLAIKYCNEAMKILKESADTHSVVMIFVLGIVGQVFLNENALEQLLDVVGLLQKYRQLPIAITVQRWLLDEEHRKDIGGNFYTVFKGNSTKEIVQKEYLDNNPIPCAIRLSGFSPSKTDVAYATMLKLDIENLITDSNTLPAAVSSSNSQSSSPLNTSLDSYFYDQVQNVIEYADDSSPSSISILSSSSTSPVDQSPQSSFLLDQITQNLSGNELDHLLLDLSENVF